MLGKTKGETIENMERQEIRETLTKREIIWLDTD